MSATPQQLKILALALFGGTPAEREAARLKLIQAVDVRWVHQLGETVPPVTVGGTAWGKDEEPFDYTRWTHQRDADAQRYGQRAADAQRAQEEQRFRSRYSKAWYDPRAQQTRSSTENTDREAHTAWTAEQLHRLNEMMRRARQTQQRADSAKPRHCHYLGRYCPIPCPDWQCALDIMGKGATK